MRVKRLEAVEAYIRQVGSVSIQQLCQEFNVSINTIRRDIDALVQKGQVKRYMAALLLWARQKGMVRRSPEN